MVRLGPASLAQAGSTHRHRCCAGLAGLAHQVHLPSDQCPGKQVCGLRVPSKYFISFKAEWLSIHPPYLPSGL